MKKRSGYLFKKGASWYVAYMVNGERFKQSLRTGDKRKAQTEADRILAPFQAQAEAENIGAIKARLEVAQTLAVSLSPSVHLGQAWSRYLDAEKRKTPGKGTLADYESIFYAFKRWLKAEHPAAHNMRDVTPDLARAFLKHLEKKRELSGDRVNKHLLFLRSMFELLKEPAALSMNPWAGIPKREHIAAHRRPLTIEEMRTIIEAAEGEMKTLFMVGTFTGLRMGDCATLKWGEVDLSRGIIHRIPRKTSRRGVSVTIGIPGILGMHLAELPRQGPYVMPDTAKTYLERKEYLSRRIQAHLVKCGIDTMGEGTGKRAACVAGFHSLRHSFVSLHAQAGTSQAVMQKLVGHGNPGMTQHYTTIDEATATASARALPAILGDPVELKREPLPPWAVEAVKKAKSLKQLKAELLTVAK